MKYAKEGKLKAGDFVLCDDGFTCLADDAKREVLEDEHGLFIRCREGRHGLDGQLNEHGEYVGLEKM